MVNHMIVMWVLTETLGISAKLFNEEGNTKSGGWIEAYQNETGAYRINGNLELHIVITHHRQAYIYDESSSTHYHLINVSRRQGKNNNGKYNKEWEEIISKIHPDIIQIWGTELPVGLDVENVAGEIPIVFFIQGVMSAIYAHNLGDLRPKAFLKSVDILFPLKMAKLVLQKNRLKSQSSLEKAMIKNSKGIIVDSDWAAAQYVGCNVDHYRVPLAINKCFKPFSWDYRECCKYSIFTVYGKSPIKGLHILFEALPDVIVSYPETKVIIPGDVMPKSISQKLLSPLYVGYLQYLIKKYRLEKHIVLPGRLTHEQMFEEMKKSNVFVLPSCIENHSSTLREAMTVGCPCIASDVGSTFEFVKHGENGFLYRFNESRTLSYYIKKVFEAGQDMQSMGNAASKTIQEKYPQDSIGRKMMDAYNTILQERK